MPEDFDLEVDLSVDATSDETCDLVVGVGPADAFDDSGLLDYARGIYAVVEHCGGAVPNLRVSTRPGASACDGTSGGYVELPARRVVTVVLSRRGDELRVLVRSASGALYCMRNGSTTVHLEGSEVGPLERFYIGSNGVTPGACSGTLSAVRYSVPGER